MSQMGQPSPAPWTIEKYTNATTRDGERIKAANGLVIVPEVWGSSLAECDANYALIAAAPDLLAALKFLVGALESGQIVRDITKDAAPDWALQMMEFVRDLGKISAAIAKAEGGFNHVLRP